VEEEVSKRGVIGNEFGNVRRFCQNMEKFAVSVVYTAGVERQLTILDQDYDTCITGDRKMNWNQAAKG
jgi:hypothetical protein